jgi:5-methylcytosine-specific restriction endonuclease McrA
MHYIDKSIHRQQGLGIIQEFLDNNCKESDGRHTEIRYDDRDPGGKTTLSKSGYKAMLRRILLQDQECCCYCLRILRSGKKKEFNDDAITFEHIIPRSCVNVDEAQYYSSAPGLSSKEVVLRNTYESPSHSQQKFVHPHNVAYNNLVLSCAGTFPVIDSDVHSSPLKALCCNEARGDKEAYPIYLYQDVADYIEYLKNGDIQAVPTKPLYDKVHSMIENTNLNCTSLKQIRKIWYLLRNESMIRISSATKSEEKRKSLLSQYLFASATDEEAFDLFEKFSKQAYWDTLMLYRQFHNIMKLIELNL